MGGLQEIINEIGNQSRQEIDEIMNAANNECRKIRKEALLETERLIEDKKRQSEKDANLAMEKIKSAADMNKKQNILRVKQQMIAQILEKTKEKLSSLGDREYFEILSVILEKNAHSEKGYICFNSRDLNRVPDDFVENIRQKGINLEISKNPVDICDGMILDYGDIQENCTFEAIINANKDRLCDKINDCLFKAGR